MSDRTRQTGDLVSDNNIFADVVNDRIGIGIENPQAKLHVEGDLKVANLDYDYTNNGYVSGVDASSFFTGLKHPDGDSISNTTNTAGILFLEGDIGKEVVSLTQYSGSFSIYTKNSTYDYCDNYINASPSDGMSFGSSGGYNFYATQASGNGPPSSTILTLSDTGNVGIGTVIPDALVHLLSTDSSVYSSTSDQRSEAEIRIVNSDSTTGSFASVNFYNGEETGGDVSLNSIKTSENYISDFTIKIRAGGGSTDWRERLRIEGNDGAILPGSDALQDLGSPSARWANIYSADLQLSNEGSHNDVDGTWGQYTIQEGEEDLFLINRRSGKKYKFVLQEVS